MGATTNDKSQLLFLNKGKFNFKVTDQAWGSHEAWEGWVTGVTWKFIEPKDDKKGFEAINLHMDDGQEKCTITCKFDSGYGRGIAQTLFGIDITKPVKVSASYVEENGKKRGSFFMSQFNQNIKWAFTKDNPGGMPPAKEIEYNGDKLYDRREQMAWLKQKIQEEVLPKIPNALFREPAPSADPLPGTQALADVKAAQSAKSEYDMLNEGDDDLPF